MASSTVRDLVFPTVVYGSEKEASGSVRHRIAPSIAADGSSLTSYAVAHTSCVFGIASSRDVDADEERWWTWNTPFTASQVLRVASNSDGTIIAVASDAGTVSLLRGSDGKVLATRTVANSGFPASLCWIRDDIFLIESSNLEGLSQLILVSNVDGKALNNNDSSQVTKAVAKIAISNLSPPDMLHDIRALSGYMGTPGTIRCVACEFDRSLVVFDYSLGMELSTLVQAGIAVDGTDEVWTIDYSIGLKAQAFEDKTFFVFSAFQEKHSSVFWFDPTNLRSICRYDVSTWPPQRRAQVLAVEAVQSFSRTEALAIALAEKSAGDTPSASIRVVQVAVDETMGLTLITRPHTLFSIPIDGSVRSISLAPSSSLYAERPYSFHYKEWKVDGECAFKEWSPESSLCCAIGKIRLYLELGDFDRADDIVNSTCVGLLENFPYARFDPSEVSLKRVQHWVAQGKMGNVAQATECLRCLSAGVSRKEAGLSLFLEGVHSVLRLSSEQGLLETLSLASVIVSTLKDLRNVLPAKETGFEDTIRELEEQLSSLRFLEPFFDGLQLSTPIREIRSPASLLAVLIKERQFNIAERLCRSDLLPEITVECLVSPILKLNGSVHPKDYMSLLREIVMPRLAAGDELLSSLRSWACRVADELDDKENGGIDEALTLLQCVDRCSRALSVKIHSSFAIMTPFMEHTHHGKRGKSLIDEAAFSMDCNESAGAVASLDRRVSERKEPLVIKTTLKPIPTILELDPMKRGATKASVRSISRVLDDEIEYDGSGSCVEDKRTEAECLQRARALGLARNIVDLRSFSRSGGSFFVATELVRSISTSATDHATRADLFSEKVRPFCDDFVVPYDSALLACIEALCGEQNISNQAVEEAESIARCCSSVIIKCRASLALLRSALRCGLTASWLTTLSVDAISWASCDSGLQSELEEVSRLLLINGIVVKYCGLEARELFRVDNPLHAMRLLDFVVRHVEDPFVVSDMLSLCDAFHHLSPLAASCSLLQHAIRHDAADLLAAVFRQLLHKDVTHALKALVSVVLATEELLLQASHSLDDMEVVASYQTKASRALHRLHSLTSTALESSASLPSDIAEEICCCPDDNSLESVQNNLSKLIALHDDHMIFFTISDLGNVGKVVDATCSLLERVVASSSDSADRKTRISAVKRACRLLSCRFPGHSCDIWALASAHTVNSRTRADSQDDIIDLLSELDLLDGARTELAVRAQVFVALTLCSKSSSHTMDNALAGMARFVTAASLLLHWAVRTSSHRLLSSVLSLASRLDIIGQILTRTDEGLGERLEALRQSLQDHGWKLRSSLTLVENSTVDAYVRVSRIHRPAMHPSWYVGDGLLLPPQGTLAYCNALCQEFLSRYWTIDPRALEQRNFAESRGAHSVALRVLVSSVSNLLSLGKSTTITDVDIASVLDALKETSTSLAERSLGGTGTGITNAVVDSQLAVAFLLLLPSKVAFQVYKACLPTALKTQNHERVRSLASIGVVAASSEGQSAKYVVRTGWRGQSKLFEQCSRLAETAQWYIILRIHGVEFDPFRFEDRQAIDTRRSTQEELLSLFDVQYASSRLSLLIAALSPKWSIPDVVRLSTRYAESFGLPPDLVFQKHAEFLLLPLELAIDFRRDIKQCEKAARMSLSRLQKAEKRLQVMRHCLIVFENSTFACQDYERYGLVLSLYHECLWQIIDRGSPLGSVDSSLFEAELELLDRRRDALAILSSFFTGSRLSLRPPVSNFFVPMQIPFTLDVLIMQKSHCGILGRFGMTQLSHFDPLRSLDEILASSVETATVTSLAPLCVPLALPQGYIHVRCLLLRFHKSSVDGTEMPSFENDVVQCVNRIRSAQEKAILSEWCASQYKNQDQEKLKCLDLALSCAVEASTAIEQNRRCDPHSKDIEKQEIEALETLKRLSSKKDTLADLLRVKGVLRSADSTRQGAVWTAVERLIGSLECNTKDCSPEHLIDFLLSAGSSIASDAAVNDDLAFDIKSFREFSSLVHAACNSVAEEHSHIHPAQHAKRLSKQWLFHGDDTCSSFLSLPDLRPMSPSNVISHCEEESTEFVMDLNDIHDSGKLGPTLGLSAQDNQRITSCEEVSVIKLNAAREMSELNCQRAALRIAFVMAHDEVRTDARSTQKENSMVLANQTRSSSSKRIGLLRKTESKTDSASEARVFDRSRDLLSIAFAKDGAAHAFFSRSPSESQSAASLTSPAHQKTITFAMRHRALRVAAVLCPQEALEAVVRAEGYLAHSDSDSICKLSDCAFGAFVAKEIEEMGLPLPHSDLGRLSSIQFLSFARTIWRHHRDSELKSRGRLLLLLVEMSLRNSETDTLFVSGLLQELIRGNLPRSLLMASERVCEYIRHFRSTDSVLHDAFQSAVSVLSSDVLAGVRGIYCDRNNCNVDEASARSVTKTIDRLLELVATIRDGQQLLEFVNALEEIAQYMEGLWAAVVRGRHLSDQLALSLHKRDS